MFWRMCLKAGSQHLDHWSESYQNTSRHCAEERRGIISEMMPWRNKSVCLLFYPLHFILSSSFIWGNTDQTDHFTCSHLLVIVTLCWIRPETRECNSITCKNFILHTLDSLESFSAKSFRQDVPRAKWRQGDIPSKWHLSGWGRTWGRDASYE